VQLHLKLNNIFLGIGGIVTTINPAYTASEVGRQLVMSKTKFILTIKKSLKIVEEAVQKVNRKDPFTWAIFDAKIPAKNAQEFVLLNAL